jgi:hypothetical protein
LGAHLDLGFTFHTQSKVIHEVSQNEHEKSKVNTRFLVKLRQTEEFGNDDKIHFIVKDNKRRPLGYFGSMTIQFRAKLLFQQVLEQKAVSLPVFSLC